MVEYLDFDGNIRRFVDNVYDERHDPLSELIDHTTFSPSQTVSPPPIDKSFWQVRDAVCVVGRHDAPLRAVKRTLAALHDGGDVALESFHVRDASDVSDGALLVPKVLLVAQHIPGQKVLDDDNDDGQLDLLYDEACDVGADLMLVYMGLPVVIYPEVTRALWHPKLEDLVFPGQPLLRMLAMNNSLLTVTAGCELNEFQKNVLKEWLQKPVDKSHPVYKVADDRWLQSERMASWCAKPNIDPTLVIVSVDDSQSYDNRGYDVDMDEHPFCRETRGRERNNSGKRLNRQTSKLEVVNEDATFEMDMYDNDVPAATGHTGNSEAL